MNNRDKDPVILFENLIKSFEDNGYPEYYGGSYIENNTLFIIVSRNNAQIRKDLVKRSKGSNFFIKGSTGNLTKRVVDELDSLSLDFFKYPNLKFYSYYLDNKTQKIIIFLGDTTKENLDFFKYEIMESPYFVFEYTSPIVSE